MAAARRAGSGGAGVLFICTGNIFRSMTAEYALRAALPADAPVAVRSAGIEAAPRPVIDFVRDHLARRGYDISGHVPTRLTAALLRQADLPVAMGAAHQAQIRDLHGLELPLFSELAYGEINPLPDVWEAVPDWRNNLDASVAYAQQVIDYICNGMAGFVARGLGPAAVRPLAPGDTLPPTGRS